MLKILNVRSDDIVNLIKKQGENLTSEQLSQPRPSFEVRRKLSGILVKSLLPEVPDVSIRRHESGRPYLTSTTTEFLPHISISHSGSWIGIVLSAPDQYTTLDLEDMTLPRSHQKIANNFFTEHEQLFFKEEGLIGFYKIWTAKEALAKNLDQTISSLLSVDIGQLLINRPLDTPFNIDYLDHRFTLNQNIPENTQSLMVTLCERH
ncbi:MAG: 4'-phosphopantetheinyl transferase superfamily protein [Candidatus Paracaedibacteraceae bacterium]|nr:4'-phosphopantetheinyl transferase superfamily protein [Candidatus Paracaedibacteraceae bacterium]